jgi:kynurenine formamidase
MAEGRFGPEDERGALNLITPGRVRDAAALVREGRTFALGQPVGRRTPMPPHRIAPAHFMDRVGGDYVVAGERIEGFQYSDDTLLVALHTGTHIDSLAHVWDGDHLYNGFSPETITSKSGATRCGIDKMGPIVGRGVLLDFGALGAGREIRAEELERCAEAEGVEIREGDVVLLRTGWLQEAGSEPARYFSAEPGVGAEGAAWLAERGVAATGCDNYAYEVLPVEGEPFPVHRLLIRDSGIPLIEGLVLDELASARAYEFLFVALPLPVAGGTGSPIAPVAVA